MGYRKIALTGMSWMMSLNIIAGVLSVIKIAIVARLLAPQDFGVLGIALLSLALMELLTETGINVVLIQPGRELASYIDSAWVVSIVRGIIISALLIILSPLVANFFHSPKSLMVLLILSLVPFIRGFINPTEIIFQKELKFHYEFVFRVLIFAVDAFVSILLVLITKSVLSLVFGMIAGVLFELLVSFVLIKPIPKLNFNREYLSEIFHKGKWVTFYGLFNYVGQNADDIFVGRILGAYTLGIYQLAYKIGTFTVTEITDVVNQVFFPLYSKMFQEKKNLVKVFLNSTFVLSIVVIPISLIIFFFPREVIMILLGSKWLSAVTVLKVLVLYGMLRSIVGYPSSLFLAMSQQKYVAYMTFVRATILCILIVPLIYNFGVLGAAYAAIISVIAEIPMVLYLLIKVFNTT